MARQWAAEALCFAFLVKSLQFLLVRKQPVRYNKPVCFLSEELRMSRMETESGRSDRIELRATPHEKALLARAAAIEHLDDLVCDICQTLHAEREKLGIAAHRWGALEQTPPTHPCRQWSLKPTGFFWVKLPLGRPHFSIYDVALYYIM